MLNDDLVALRNMRLDRDVLVKERKELEDAFKQQHASLYEGIVKCEEAVKLAEESINDNRSWNCW
jgi:hypothetical protein